MPNGRHAKLLEDEDVARWYRNTARGSEKTANNWLRMLGLFCERTEKTPQDLFKLDAEKLADLLEDYVEEFQSKSAATHVVLKAVKSLMQRKGIAITRRIKVERRGNVTEQHVPSQADLRTVLGTANLRARAAIALIAFSGQRLEVLGDSDDGLRLGDIVDLSVDDGELHWKQVPARFIVRVPLSKTRKPYFSFIGPEGVAYIEAYLRARMQRGEKLTKNTVVIGAVKAEGGREADYKGGEKPITTTNIGDFIRKAMRAAGINERPYIWRSYFSVHADMCRDYPKDWREFNMGHGGDEIARTYSLNKSLPAAKIDAMRAAYAKALPLLETTEREALIAVNSLDKKVAALLSAFGFDKEAYESLSAEEIATLAQGLVDSWTKERERQQNMAARLLATAQQPAAVTVRPAQSIMKAKELPAALARGARVIVVLPDGNVVVEG